MCQEIEVKTIMYGGAQWWYKGDSPLHAGLSPYYHPAVAWLPTAA